MKNWVNIFKYVSYIIVAVIAWLLLKDLRCGGSGGTQVKNDTIIIRDTQWLAAKTETAYISKPYRVTLHDTLEIEGEPIMAYYPLDRYPPIVQKVFSDWNSTKYYADSFPVDYGKLYLYDTLRSGKLRKGFSLQQSIPLVTETKTITVHEKPRVVVYGGLTVMGNPSTPIFGTGAKVGFIAKNGKYYGGSYIFTKNQGQLYQFDILLPIRLRKK